MAKNEAETRYELIDPVLRAKGYRLPYIRLETPAPVEPTGPKGRRRPGPGKTDYLLCVEVPGGSRPLPVAILEAKKEDEDCLKGMQQAKGYSECERFDAKYIFSTIRAMVHTIEPRLGETIYDPCCGTGGFLAIGYEHIARNLGQSPASTDIDKLKHETFFGREKDNLIFPIVLANLVLHGIDQPNIWHGNALTARASYAALFEKAPKTFNVILTNPPFGSKEGKDAQKHFAFPTSSTQVLFVQDILGELAPDGRCGIVLDDGFLFRKDENAFVETKRKLVDECDVWAIVRMPLGVFVGAGASVNTNLVFFTKGRKTQKIWYYDLSHLTVGKKSPMTLAHFGFAKDGQVLDDADLPTALTEEWVEDENNVGELFPSYARLLPLRGTPEAESRYSWTIDFAARRKQAREDMKPHLAEAERAKAEVVALKEKLKVLKTLKTADANGEDSETIESRLRAQEKAARDAQAAADALDVAVFDLKAVNPNAIVKVDTRTSAEVIQSIEGHAKVVANALDTLKMLLEGQTVGHI